MLGYCRTYGIHPPPQPTDQGLRCGISIELIFSGDQPGGLCGRMGSEDEDIGDRRKVRKILRGARPFNDFVTGVEGFGQGAAIRSGCKTSVAAGNEAATIGHRV
jgi:hypothetical protein